MDAVKFALERCEGIFYQYFLVWGNSVGIGNYPKNALDEMLAVDWSIFGAVMAPLNSSEKAC